MLRQTYLVLMEGAGDPVAVVTDQRDWAKLEAADFRETMNFTRTRYIAWSAMCRAGQYAGPFERFNERDCVDVALPDKTEDDDDQGKDHGRRVTFEGT
jgi:hypothetical protein